MELPKPRTTNIIDYSRMVAMESIPIGGILRKPTKAGRWRIKPPRRPAGVCFNLKGECFGDEEEVVNLGVKLAKEAMARGDVEYAKAIMERIKNL